MSFSVFNPNQVEHRTQPMFFGEPVNIARYESQKYPEFEDYSERQISFFWRPEEVQLGGDRSNYLGFDKIQRHVYTSNLEYQILMDSIQGRAPTAVLSPITSLPELEHWFINWTFSENVHSRSYTHMIRNIMQDPSASFDSILAKPEIQERARQVGRYYDALHKWNVRQEAASLWPGMQVMGFKDGGVRAVPMQFGYDRREHMRAVVLCLYSVNALEAIRFYASFACTFLFHKAHKQMGGSAKIMRFIARDEALHHSSTNTILQILEDGDEGDEWARMVEECKPEATEIFREAAHQELDWGGYLFQYGSMLGMNREIIQRYVREQTNKRMAEVNLVPIFDPVPSETLPWMSEYLESGNVQNTPQEAENSQYLIDQVENNWDPGNLSDLM